MDTRIKKGLSMRGLLGCGISFGVPPDRGCLEQLYRNSGAFPAANAQRGDAAFQTALFEGVDEGDEYPRTRGTDGMTEGAGAAVDVDFVGVQAELLNSEQGDNGKGFVDFEEVDVVFAPACFVEHFVDGTNRRQGEFGRQLRVAGVGDNARNRRGARRGCRAF